MEQPQVEVVDQEDQVEEALDLVQPLQELQELLIQEAVEEVVDISAEDLQTFIQEDRVDQVLLLLEDHHQQDLQQHQEQIQLQHYQHQLEVVK